LKTFAELLMVTWDI